MTDEDRAAQHAHADVVQGGRYARLGADGGEAGLYVRFEPGFRPHAPQVRSHYGRIEGTAWPVRLTSTPEEDGLEWKLRYAPEHLTRREHLLLASVVAAYVHLTSPRLGLTEATKSLRRARQAAAVAANG